MFFAALTDCFMSYDQKLHSLTTNMTDSQGGHNPICGGGQREQGTFAQVGS